jgi:hypothetical protein
MVTMPEQQLFTRALSLAPSSLDLEARTCEAIISSGASVLRRGIYPDGTGFGPWHEKLSVAGADLSKLTGAPVLLDHRSTDSTARIGVVEAVRREGGQLVARLRFSERQDVAPLLQDLADGIGGAVSIGYEVAEWKSNAA